ncbi:MAG: PQQ-binding-like beta-propeller repeat protein [Pirellulales bacterium]
MSCVDAANGETIWLSRYQRVHRVQAEYPRPNRFRYRDGNTAIVHQGLVICLPQDCPEMFALDAFTGELVWSTNESEVADCTYVVGTSGGSLILGGDRVVWLASRNGQVVSHFPAPSTPGTIHALPQPRALGRIALAGNQVMMTTSDRVYLFAADQAEFKASTNLPTQPKILEQLSTRHCGGEGGIWTLNSQTLVIATPGRLICFRAEN